MKLCALLVFTLLLSLSAGAEHKNRTLHGLSQKIQPKNLICVADTNGSQRIELEVILTMGSAPEQKVEYNGHSLAVGFYPGSPFEGQQLLTIEMDGYITRIYDPKDSLYMVEASDGVKVQCYFDRRNL